MINKNKPAELILFIISLGVFISAAVLGWIRLQYGFNFIDEGWQMTEAWRLTVGDDLLRDKFTGALRNATLLNALVFKMYPEISLLEFRKLYFILSILSLFFFSVSLYRTTSHKVFFYPMIFSIFSFTGLDVTGIVPYLQYYTYPHFFLTVHLSFFILGVIQESPLLRKVFFFISGIFLWLLSFSLLHLALIVVSIIIIFVIMKLIRVHRIHFSFMDVFMIALPFILLWTMIIAIYGKNFIANIVSSFQIISSLPTYRIGLLLTINWEHAKLMIASLIFLVVFFMSARILKTTYMLGVQAILATLLWSAIQTNLWGFYKGGTSGALWFACLLLSSSFLFLFYLIVKIARKENWEQAEIINLILFVSATVAAINGIFFSSFGLLVAVFSSIPMVAAMIFSFLSLRTIQRRSFVLRWIMTIILLTPFYYTMSSDRWNFNFYDVSPQQATVEIKEGFCKGIKTNPIYKDLYEWISRTSNAYSAKDDFIISYVSSPMVHMIARRRPATDDSYIAFDVLPLEYFDKSLKFAIKHGRRPRLVYVFEAMPALISLNPENPYLIWMNQQITFPANDPFSKYIVEHMTMIERFTISEQLSIYARCFIDNAYRLETSLNQNHP